MALSAQLAGMLWGFMRQTVIVRAGVVSVVVSALTSIVSRRMMAAQRHGGRHQTLQWQSHHDQEQHKFFQHASHPEILIADRSSTQPQDSGHRSGSRRSGLVVSNGRGITTAPSKAR